METAGGCHVNTRTIDEVCVSYSHACNLRHSRKDVMWYVGEVIVVNEESSQSRDASKHVCSQRCQVIAAQVPVSARGEKQPSSMICRLDTQCTFTQKTSSTASVVYTPQTRWSSQESQKATSFKGLFLNAWYWVVVEIPTVPSNSQMHWRKPGCTGHTQNDNSQAP